MVVYFALLPMQEDQVADVQEQADHAAEQHPPHGVEKRIVAFHLADPPRRGAAGAACDGARASRMRHSAMVP